MRVYLGSLAETGRRAQRSALRVVAELVEGHAVERVDRVAWHRVGFERAEAVRAGLARRYAPATANRMLAALRGVLRACWRLGLMSSDEYLRAADVGRVRGSALPRGRALAGDEVERLYEACLDGTVMGLRDGAAIALMHAAGLRRAEVVALDVGAVDVRSGAVTVHGKGRRQREVYLGAGVEWVEEWLAVRGPEPGPLLVEVRFGEAVNRRLSDDAVYWLVKRRAARARVARCGPHDLRRTFATALLSSGKDINLVRQLLGHASVETTTIYDRRGSVELASAQRAMVIPRARRQAGREVR